MKIVFSCIHFPVWPYPPKIMRFFNYFIPGKLYGLTLLDVTLFSKIFSANADIIFIINKMLDTKVV